MLIKTADDKSSRLAALESAMHGASPESKRAKEDFHILKAGIKGEQDSAYLIDFHYGEANRNWAVIHDLRIEHNGRVAQIDHVLINRFLEVYALETKHFNSGIRITEEGEFLRWNAWKKSYDGMPSPLAQNERHIAVLRDALAALPLPERMGIRLQPSFVSYILVSNQARIIRPKKFNTRQVIKADQLKQRIDREFDEIAALSVLAKVTKLISSETLRGLAGQLAALHAPLESKPPPSKPSAPHERQGDHPHRAVDAAPVVAAQRVLPGPRCKGCGSIAGSIQYGQYGYYFKCPGCHTNAAIRFTCEPGHKPRLRKAGHLFFRDCPECHSSEPFHANPSPT